MTRLPIRIDTSLTTREATATRQGFIDFIIGDKLTDYRGHGHIGVILTQRQGKLLQSLLQTLQLVIVETQNRAVITVGFQKPLVLRHKNRAELRIFQLICQCFGFVGETTATQLLKRRKTPQLSAVLGQVMDKIPE